MQKFRPFNIVFLRHAESYNNTLHHDISNPEFDLARHHDAPLTERGVAQVTVAGQYVAGLEFHPPVSGVLTSYLHRALRTGLAVQDAFAEKAKSNSEVIVPIVQVWKDIHEYGGCYRTFVVGSDQQGAPGTSVVCNKTTKDQEVRKTIGLPGRTGADVTAEFPTFTFRSDEGNCPQGWWDASDDGLKRGRETLEESRRRYVQMYHDFCRYIGTQGETDIPDATRVVITHGYLYKSLCKAWIEEGWLKVSNADSIEVLNNTGITHLRFVVAEDKGTEPVEKDQSVDHPKYDVHMVFQNKSDHLESSGVGCTVPQTLKNFTM